jgi:membrane protein insertase Oxa1/YidC/SpoIIIJ
MCISLILQQITAPQIGNTNNGLGKRLNMFLMPIMFIFFSAGFPSGLLLYWTLNNTFSAFQQWWIQWRVSCEDHQKQDVMDIVE